MFGIVESSPPIEEGLELVTGNHKILEQCIIRIRDMDVTEKMFTQTLIVSTGFEYNDKIIFIDSYDAWVTFNAVGIKTFKEKKGMDQKINNMVKELDDMGKNPDNYFRKNERSLPTKGKSITYRNQLVWEITKAGFILLFTSLNFKTRVRMLDAVSLAEETVRALDKTNNAKFLEDMLEMDVTGFCLKITQLYKEVPSLSLIEHMKTSRDLIQIGLSMDINS